MLKAQKFTEVRGKFKWLQEQSALYLTGSLIGKIKALSKILNFQMINSYLTIPKWKAVYIYPKRSIALKMTLYGTDLGFLPMHRPV